MKMMRIAEFREIGFVQEINRQILHPAGLALVVEIDHRGSESLGGVWDERRDPEGIYFTDQVALGEKASAVANVINHRSPERMAALGYVVQPVDLEPEIATVPDRVQAMCDWVSNLDECRGMMSHRDFHHGYQCPYYAVAEVLRGNPDPRRDPRFANDQMSPPA